MAQQAPHPYADFSPHALWQAGKVRVAQTLVQQGFRAVADPSGRSDPDIVVSGEDGQVLAAIKVKTKGPRSARLSTWQWSVWRAQEALEEPAHSYFVLVDLAPQPPEYYLARRSDIARLVLDRHQDFLNRHGGVRPRNPTSQHTLIPREFVMAGKEAWHLLLELL